MKLITEVVVPNSYSSSDIIKETAKRAKLNQGDITKFEVLKESIDARKKPQVVTKLNVAIEVKNQALSKLKKFNDVIVQKKGVDFKQVNFKSPRPIIVGLGPSGLFAGLSLAMAGLKPIILEQGKCVQERQKDVDTFWNGGALNEYSNIQFGEGGAGTFSDGKLASNVSNKYTKMCINEFIECGAPEDIFYSFTPHIGSDELKKVVTNLRKKIEDYGGEVLFNTKFENYETLNNMIHTVFARNVITGKELKFETNCLILAVGHSAVSVYRCLKEKNVELKQKPFAMGVRIEGLQRDINLAQYGKIDNSLPNANYKLVSHLENGRSVFTFCMCPGGYVVASSSENGLLVTNGMSNRARDGENANSALLVNVVPEDFGSCDPLAGVDFQRKYEKLAFELGGSNGSAPIEKVGDFLDSKTENLDDDFVKVKPTYKPGVKVANLCKCLPDFVYESLKLALPKLDAKLKGFADRENILVGVESRSSAPVQIARDENLMCKIKGLFPIGEGAGYAGGITSSSADGILVAEKVIEYLKANSL